jgi:molecular chaperone DnaJ
LPRKDFYAVLGVPRTARTDDIRRAFRKLALEFHPDRNPGDPEADRRFREVAEAWDVLGDAEKRARYDRLGPLYTPDGRPPRPDEMNEILMDAINGILRRKKPGDRGEDLEYTVSLTLEQAAGGGEREISIQRTVRCRPCDGTGASSEGRQTCEACNGTGKSAARRLFRQECARCDGRGWRASGRCEPCRGDGRTVLAETLRVKVPAGVATGQKLKLKGKGNDGLALGGVAPGAPGDLYVLVSIDEHAIFRRRGADLLCEAPLTFAEAVLGTELLVPTLDGRGTTIKIPGGTPSGKSFRLPGRGLPGMNGRGKGDLHVRVLIEVPERLSPEARSALESFAARAGADAHPRRRAWDQAVRGRAP